MKPALLTPADDLLHPAIKEDMTWLETNWFGFIVPQWNAVGHIYVAFRVNLGVVFSSIMIYSRECDGPIDMDYYDSQIHLPMPHGDLDRYELANGLAVEMVRPQEKFRATYAGYGGMRFNLEFDAMMPPVDSRETIVQGGRDFSHFHKVSVEAASSVGHIDQSMMVRGSITLDGRTTQVAFPSNRDHSWSPRPEQDHARGNFDEGFFGNAGEDFAFHVQTANDDESHGTVTNGYLIERGELIGLKSGEGRFRTSGYRMRRIEYEVEDERGRTHRFVGTPFTGGPVGTFPNQFNVAGLTQWTYEGERGLGEYKWHWDVRQLIRPTGPHVEG